MPKPMTRARLALRRSRDLLRGKADNHENVLFVAPADDLGQRVREEARRAGMPRVIGRWIGGTPTNHGLVLRGVRRLMENEEWEEIGRLDRRSSKDIGFIS